MIFKNKQRNQGNPRGNPRKSVVVSATYHLFSSPLILILVSKEKKYDLKSLKRKGGFWNCQNCQLPFLFLPSLQQSPPMVATSTSTFCFHRKLSFIFLSLAFSYHMTNSCSFFLIQKFPNPPFCQKV